METLDVIEMGVAINQTRGEVLVFRLDNFCLGTRKVAQVGTQGDNPFPSNRDAPPLQEFPTVDVDQRATPNDQVCRAICFLSLVESLAQPNPSPRKKTPGPESNFSGPGVGPSVEHPDQTVQFPASALVI